MEPVEKKGDVDWNGGAGRVDPSEGAGQDHRAHCEG